MYVRIPTTHRLSSKALRKEMIREEQQIPVITTVFFFPIFVFFNLLLKIGMYGLNFFQFGHYSVNISWIITLEKSSLIPYLSQATSRVQRWNEICFNCKRIPLIE